MILKTSYLKNSYWKKLGHVIIGATQLFAENKVAESLQRERQDN